jgi:hypothetical protein
MMRMTALASWLVVNAEPGASVSHPRQPSLARATVTCMAIRTALFVLLLAVLVGRPGPAVAEDGDPCRPVVQALQALGMAPRYHWSMTATTPGRRRPMEREQVVIDDVVYLTPDEGGKWMKVQLTVAERGQRLAQELARNPVSACRQVGPSDEVSGVSTVLYVYHQGNASTTEGPEADKHIWVGTEDGLPRLFRAKEGPVAVTMKVDYAEIQSPLP